jgi:hypothetical protein
MRKRSPFKLLLLALLLTASNVAMAAHEVGHTMGPDESQQCPLCVSGTQPCIESVPNAVLELPRLENFQTDPEGTGCLQSHTVYHDQNPRAPPSIA